MLQGTERTADNAKRLRREMTMPEVLLWQRLRARPGGLKFRRQHPAGNYILDFYCHEARVVIEIDGAVHDMGDCPFTDEQRDAAFRTLGLQILRIPARDVLADPDEIANVVVTSCLSARNAHLGSH